MDSSTKKDRLIYRGSSTLSQPYMLQANCLNQVLHLMPRANFQSLLALECLNFQAFNEMTEMFSHYT